MIPTSINGRYEPILLPKHRHRFHTERVEWECDRIASMHDHLKVGDTIVDVGAEWGDLPALWASWIGPDGGIVLVEPSPGYWPTIRATWNANKFPTPAACFAGFAADTTDLSPLRDEARIQNDGWPLCSRDAITDDPGFHHLGQEADHYARVRLDDLLDDPVDAVTIDVEGAELAVLRGMRYMLADDRPLVWVSCHFDKAWMDEVYPGQDLGPLLRYMDCTGYDGERLHVDHEDHWLFVPQ